MNKHGLEVESGERFEFGKNWQAFLSLLNDERIIQAEQSIKKYLQIESLEGLSFIDVGSGSGLFSLAARRLGAQVHSFDYDPQSVQCTNELKNRYFKDDDKWFVEQGSVLDDSYLSKLGEFDIVYSWGVLHHSGDMWKALDNITSLVKDEGILFISLYNDQGGQSKRWKILKQTYNKLPNMFKMPYAVLVMGPREVKLLALTSLKGKPFAYFNRILHYSEYSMRGMSYWHDLVDWIGGYPFEVSKPEEIISFFYQRNFTLQKLKTCGGSLACNEYVFINSLTRRNI